MNQLGFQWRTFESEMGAYDFLDYLIDDTPMPTWLGWMTGETNRWSDRWLVTPFWRGVNRQRARGLYSMFRGRTPGDVTADRIPLYVCSDCGDYGCGVISVTLEVKADTVRWLDLSESDGTNLVANVPALEFERTAYLEALAATRAI